MEYYIPTILAGVVLVVMTGWLVTVEEKRRHLHFKRRCHTSFVALDTNRARNLYRSHYIIGRRKRRCDIQIKDQTVSRVHATLWHDGTSFCIAPCRDMELLELAKNRKELPTVYVNGEKVPLEGVVLCWGDVIRMGNSRFMLKDTFGTEGT